MSGPRRHGSRQAIAAACVLALLPLDLLLMRDVDEFTAGIGGVVVVMLLGVGLIVHRAGYRRDRNR